MTTGMAVYAPELNNVRAALDWGLGAGGEPAIAIGLAGASGPLWAELLGEGRQRLEHAVAHFGAEIAASDQARTWLWLGLLWAVAEPTQAMAALQRAVDLYRQLGDHLGLGYSLGRLGAMLARAGRVEQATLVLAEAFPVLEHANLPKPLARYYEANGHLALQGGDLSGARAHFEKALSLYQRAGADAGVLGTLVNLADTTWALGDLDAALGIHLETIGRLRKSPLALKEMLGASLTNLAGVHTERGEFEHCACARPRGAAVAQRSRLRLERVGSLCLTGGAGRQARRRGPSRRLFGFCIRSEGFVTPTQRSARPPTTPRYAARPTRSRRVHALACRRREDERRPSLPVGVGGIAGQKGAGRAASIWALPN